MAKPGLVRQGSQHLVLLRRYPIGRQQMPRNLPEAAADHREHEGKASLFPGHE